MKRRTFIKTSLATVASTAFASPSFANAPIPQANRPIRVGFIGTGNRGTGVISEMSR